MNIKKLHPLVYVFKNALPNSQEIINFFESQKEKWEKWYTFGKKLHIEFNRVFFNSIPTKEEWDAFNKKIEINNEEEKQFIKDINNAFYEGIKTFLLDNKIQLQNFCFFPYDIAKYATGGKMNYHTDYQIEREGIPEAKFHTTGVFYLNDNYDGGEISFLELNNEQEIIQKIDYKPEQGDLVIFSSNFPIYHGVKQVLKGEKYIIRTYLRHEEKPNNDWLEGISKYGEENWIAMKEEESKSKRKHLVVRKLYNGEELQIQMIEKNKGE
jgi:hypothetical protein